MCDSRTLLSVDDSQKLTTCLLANITVCEESKKNEFVVIVYNPLSKVIPNHYIKLPVDSISYRILDANGKWKKNKHRKLYN